MKFYHYGNFDNPVIVILTGSFCPAAALDYLYEPLSKNYYRILQQHPDIDEKFSYVHV